MTYSIRCDIAIVISFWTFSILSWVLWFFDPFILLNLPVLQFLVSWAPFIPTLAPLSPKSRYLFSFFAICLGHPSCSNMLFLDAFWIHFWFQNQKALNRNSKLSDHILQSLLHVCNYHMFVPYWLKIAMLIMYLTFTYGSSWWAH
jgi:hypothetical protein